MPLYEFQCRSCGRVQEVLRAVGDVTPPECDECRGRTDKVASACLVKFGYAPRPHDRAKDIWEGTPLADGDGINRVHYESEKVQVDHGAPPL